MQPEAELIIELKDIGAVIKPQYSVAPITERIAAMNLPVSDWEVMEEEIVAGKFGYNTTVRRERLPMIWSNGVCPKRISCWPFTRLTNGNIRALR